MSKSEVQKVMELLISTERVADLIMVNKREIVELDKRRQSTREALREIKKTSPETEKKFWVTIGSLLIKLKRDKAIDLLTKDQIKIDCEINKLRSDQKTLVNEHRDLEHLSPFSGTNLKPLSGKEFSALKANLPIL